ncbi:hypothetical protein [Parasitella parasitica]|uniref:Protein Zds1 C-terminal domain-containing protein n=1 Tax=Parasitella parasitica TaxID=35722 RepID=A0A0B7N5Q2_9FUNG|nr:hypothetical protein [Parasitella parasitica]
MSTYYIYPLNQKDQNLHHHQQNNESGLSPLKSLSATGLSRILEIPLCLLENANSNDQQQQQLYWLTNAHLNNNNNNSNNSSPNNATPKEDPTAISATNEIVTHSFANRKRSIVKRRKSVLSSSFTAEDEAEAILADREQTLAALERGQPKEGERKEENKEDTTIKEGTLEHDSSLNKEASLETENSLYFQKKLTFDVDHADMHAFKDVEKSQEKNRGNLEKEQNVDEEENSNIPVEQVKIQRQHEQHQQQVEGANVMNLKDSAIDLRATALEQDKPDKEQPSHCVVVADNDENNNSSCTKVIDLSLASSTTSALSSPSCSPSMKTTPRKKKSSWSPRRMFSTSSKKPTRDEKQEKFNISSLFSRRPSSEKSNDSNGSSGSKHRNRSSLECADATKEAVVFNYTRLPIHTERAIYRLSHLKLTNPRRPLRDQVIISNLMFWYLSLVSTNNNTETELAPTMEHLAMTKKACRMQQQQLHNKKRRVRNQIRPENSNAMDLISQQPKKNYQHPPQINKKLGTRPYSTSNSSSEDDDDDVDGDQESDTDSDDNSDSLSLASSTSSSSTLEDVEFIDDKKKSKKTRNFSIFNNNNNNSKKKDKKWLPSFSKGTNRQKQQKQQQQQHPQQEDEDDIPLAMYQKK